ncbi:MAG: GlxA family transcriptional regulator [Rhodospirillales bacterium]
MKKTARRLNYGFLGPARPQPRAAPLLRIGIAPMPDFTLFSLSNLVEFLRHAADESDFSRQLYCSWALLSHDHNPVRSSCGFEVTPTALFRDPTAFDYIVVHGGLLHSKARIPPELREFILKAKDKDVPLVGLCTGQFLLAEMGLLDGRRCAVHFSLEDAARKLFPKITPVINEPVVRDGPFITCPGGLAALSLGMELVGRHCGHSRVSKVLHYFMADDSIKLMPDSALCGDERAFDCIDRRVTRAVALMRQKTFETANVSDIARQAGTTKRELTRLFKKHLRTPPGEYWRGMRLSSARWMIVNTDRSVAQIAHECGFADSSHFIRWFKRSYNTTPAKMRRIHGDIGAH